jgi:hypothetical protein
MRAEVMVRRFVIMAAVAWPLVSLAMLLFAGGRTALAFVLTFLLVAGDFWWMSWGLAKLLGAGEVPRGAQRWFLMGIAFRSLLLLLGIYGIFLILPKESLGVVLGIGCPLVLLTAAGAMPTRG